jgi:hypothetical protein
MVVLPDFLDELGVTVLRFVQRHREQLIRRRKIAR